LPLVLLLSKEDVREVLTAHDKLHDYYKYLMSSDDKRQMALNQLCDLLCVRVNPYSPASLRPPLSLPTPPTTPQVQAPVTSLDHHHHHGSTPQAAVAEATEAAKEVAASVPSLDQPQAMQLIERPATPGSAQIRPAMPQAKVFCCCMQGLVLRLRVIEEGARLRAGQKEHCAGALVLRDIDALAKVLDGNPVWFHLHHDYSAGPLRAGMGAGEVLLALHMVNQELHVGIIASKGLTSAADELGEVDAADELGEVDAGQSNDQTTPGKFKCDLSVDNTKLESTKGQNAAWGWAGTKQDQLRLNTGDHSVSGVRITDASEAESNHQGWSVEWEEEDIHTIDLSSLIEQQKREAGVGMQMDISVLELTDLSSLGNEGTPSNTKGKEKTIPWNHGIDTADITLVASIKVPKRKGQSSETAKLHGDHQEVHLHPRKTDVWVTNKGARTIAFSHLHPSAQTHNSQPTSPAMAGISRSNSPVAVRAASPSQADVLVLTPTKEDALPAPSEPAIESAIVVSDVSSPKSSHPSSPTAPPATPYASGPAQDTLLELTLSLFSDAKEQPLGKGYISLEQFLHQRHNDKVEMLDLNIDDGRSSDRTASDGSTSDGSTSDGNASDSSASDGDDDGDDDHGESQLEHAATKHTCVPRVETVDFDPPPLVLECMIYNHSMFKTPEQLESKKSKQSGRKKSVQKKPLKHTAKTTATSATKDLKRAILQAFDKASEASREKSDEEAAATSIQSKMRGMSARNVKRGGSVKQKAATLIQSKVRGASARNVKRGGSVRGGAFGRVATKRKMDKGDGSVDARKAEGEKEATQAAAAGAALQAQNAAAAAKHVMPRLRKTVRLAEKLAEKRRYEEKHGINGTPVDGPDTLHWRMLDESAIVSNGYAGDQLAKWQLIAREQKELWHEIAHRRQQHHVNKDATTTRLVAMVFKGVELGIWAMPSGLDGEIDNNKFAEYPSFTLADEKAAAKRKRQKLILKNVTDMAEHITKYMVLGRPSSWWWGTNMAMANAEYEGFWKDLGLHVSLKDLLEAAATSRRPLDLDPTIQFHARVCVKLDSVACGRAEAMCKRMGDDTRMHMRMRWYTGNPHAGPAQWAPQRYLFPGERGFVAEFQNCVVVAAPADLLLEPRKRVKWCKQQVHLAFTQLNDFDPSQRVHSTQKERLQTQPAGCGQQVGIGLNVRYAEWWLGENRFGWGMKDWMTRGGIKYAGVGAHVYFPKEGEQKSLVHVRLVVQLYSKLRAEDEGAMKKEAEEKRKQKEKKEKGKMKRSRSAFPAGYNKAVESNESAAKELEVEQEEQKASESESDEDMEDVVTKEVLGGDFDECLTAGDIPVAKKFLRKLGFVMEQTKIMRRSVLEVVDAQERAVVLARGGALQMLEIFMTLADKLTGEDGEEDGDDHYSGDDEQTAVVALGDVRPTTADTEAAKLASVSGGTFLMATDQLSSRALNDKGKLLRSHRLNGGERTLHRKEVERLYEQLLQRLPYPGRLVDDCWLLYVLRDALHNATSTKRTHLLLNVLLSVTRVAHLRKAFVEEPEALAVGRQVLLPLLLGVFENKDKLKARMSNTSIDVSRMINTMLFNFFQAYPQLAVERPTVPETDEADGDAADVSGTGHSNNTLPAVYGETVETKKGMRMRGIDMMNEPASSCNMLLEQADTLGALVMELSLGDSWNRCSMPTPMALPEDDNLDDQEAEALDEEIDDNEADEKREVELVFVVITHLYCALSKMDSMFSTKLRSRKDAEALEKNKNQFHSGVSVEFDNDDAEDMDGDNDDGANNNDVDDVDDGDNDDAKVPEKDMQLYEQAAVAFLALLASKRGQQCKWLQPEADYTPVRMLFLLPGTFPRNNEVAFLATRVVHIIVFKHSLTQLPEVFNKHQTLQNLTAMAIELNLHTEALMEVFSIFALEMSKGYSTAAKVAPVTKEMVLGGEGWKNEEEATRDVCGIQLALFLLTQMLAHEQLKPDSFALAKLSPLLKRGGFQPIVRGEAMYGSTKPAGSDFDSRLSVFLFPNEAVTSKASAAQSAGKGAKARRQSYGAAELSSVSRQSLGKAICLQHQTTEDREVMGYCPTNSLSMLSCLKLLVDPKSTSKRKIKEILSAEDAEDAEDAENAAQVRAQETDSSAVHREKWDKEFAEAKQNAKLEMHVLTPEKRSRCIVVPAVGLLEMLFAYPSVQELASGVYANRDTSLKKMRERGLKFHLPLMELLTSGSGSTAGFVGCCGTKKSQLLRGYAARALAKLCIQNSWVLEQVARQGNQVLKDSTAQHTWFEFLFLQLQHDRDTTHDEGRLDDLKNELQWAQDGIFELAAVLSCCPTCVPLLINVNVPQHLLRVMQERESAQPDALITIRGLMLWGAPVDFSKFNLQWFCDGLIEADHADYGGRWVGKRTWGSKRMQIMSASVIWLTAHASPDAWTQVFASNKGLMLMLLLRCAEIHRPKTEEHDEVKKTALADLLVEHSLSGLLKEVAMGALASLTKPCSSHYQDPAKLDPVAGAAKSGGGVQQLANRSEFDLLLKALQRTEDLASISTTKEDTKQEKLSSSADSMVQRLRSLWRISTEQNQTGVSAWSLRSELWKEICNFQHSHEQKLTKQAFTTAALPTFGYYKADRRSYWLFPYCQLPVGNIALENIDWLAQRRSLLLRSNVQAVKSFGQLALLKFFDAKKGYQTDKLASEAENKPMYCQDAWLTDETDGYIPTTFVQVLTLLGHRDPLVVSYALDVATAVAANNKLESRHAGLLFDVEIEYSPPHDALLDPVDMQAGTVQFAERAKANRASFLQGVNKGDSKTIQNADGSVTTIITNADGSIKSNADGSTPTTKMKAYEVIGKLLSYEQVRTPEMMQAMLVEQVMRHFGYKLTDASMRNLREPTRKVAGVYRQAKERIADEGAVHLSRVANISSMESCVSGRTLQQPESCTTVKGLVEEATKARNVCKEKIVCKEEIAPNMRDEATRAWLENDGQSRKTTGESSDGTSLDNPQDWIDAVHDPGVRSEESCMARMRSQLENDGNFREMYDAAYIELRFSSCKRLAHAVEAVKKLFGSTKVRRIQNRHKTPTVLGWSDICMLVEVDLPGGSTHICEIRLTHTEFVKSHAEASPSMHNLRTEAIPAACRACRVSVEDAPAVQSFILGTLTEVSAQNGDTHDAWRVRRSAISLLGELCSNATGELHEKMQDVTRMLMQKAEVLAFLLRPHNTPEVLGETARTMFKLLQHNLSETNFQKLKIWLLPSVVASLKALSCTQGFQRLELAMLPSTVLAHVMSYLPSTENGSEFVVNEVDPKMIAAKAGLKVDDVITAVNGIGSRTLLGPKALKECLHKAFKATDGMDYITLSVIRDVAIRDVATRDVFAEKKKQNKKWLVTTRRQKLTLFLNKSSLASRGKLGFTFTCASAGVAQSGSLSAPSIALSAMRLCHYIMDGMSFVQGGAGQQILPAEFKWNGQEKSYGSVLLHMDSVGAKDSGEWALRWMIQLFDHLGGKEINDAQPKKQNSLEGLAEVAFKAAAPYVDDENALPEEKVNCRLMGHLCTQLLLADEDDSSNIEEVMILKVMLKLLNSGVPAKYFFSHHSQLRCLVSLLYENQRIVSYALQVLLKLMTSSRHFCVRLACWSTGGVAALVNVIQGFEEADVSSLYVHTDVSKPEAAAGDEDHSIGGELLKKEKDRWEKHLERNLEARSLMLKLPWEKEYPDGATELNEFDNLDGDLLLKEEVVKTHKLLLQSKFFKRTYLRALQALQMLLECESPSMLSDEKYPRMGMSSPHTEGKIRVEVDVVEKGSEKQTVVFDATHTVLTRRFRQLYHRGVPVEFGSGHISVVSNSSHSPVKRAMLNARKIQRRKLSEIDVDSQRYAASIHAAGGLRIPSAFETSHPKLCRPDHLMYSDMVRKVPNKMKSHDRNGGCIILDHPFNGITSLCNLVYARGLLKKSEVQAIIDEHGNDVVEKRAMEESMEVLQAAMACLKLVFSNRRNRWHVIKISNKLKYADAGKQAKLCLHQMLKIVAKDFAKDRYPEHIQGPDFHNQMHELRTAALDVLAEFALESGVKKVALYIGAEGTMLGPKKDGTNAENQSAGNGVALRLSGGLNAMRELGIVMEDLQQGLKGSSRHLIAGEMTAEMDREILSKATLVVSRLLCSRYMPFTVARDKAGKTDDNSEGVFSLIRQCLYASQMVDAAINPVDESDKPGIEAFPTAVSKEALGHSARFLWHKTAHPVGYADLIDVLIREEWEQKNKEKYRLTDEALKNELLTEYRKENDSCDDDHHRKLLQFLGSMLSPNYPMLARVQAGGALAVLCSKGATASHAMRQAILKSQPDAETYSTHTSLAKHTSASNHEVAAFASIHTSCVSIFGARHFAERLKRKLNKQIASESNAYRRRVAAHHGELPERTPLAVDPNTAVVDDASAKDAFVSMDIEAIERGLHFGLQFCGEEAAAGADTGVKGAALLNGLLDSLMAAEYCGVDGPLLLSQSLWVAVIKLWKRMYADWHSTVNDGWSHDEADRAPDITTKPANDSSSDNTTKPIVHQSCLNLLVGLLRTFSTPSTLSYACEFLRLLLEHPPSHKQLRSNECALLPRAIQLLADTQERALDREKKEAVVLAASSLIQAIAMFTVDREALTAVSWTPKKWMKAILSMKAGGSFARRNTGTRSKEQRKNAHVREKGGRRSPEHRPSSRGGNRPSSRGGDENRPSSRGGRLTRSSYEQRHKRDKKRLKEGRLALSSHQQMQDSRDSLGMLGDSRDSVGTKLVLQIQRLLCARSAFRQFRLGGISSNVIIVTLAVPSRAQNWGMLGAVTGCLAQLLQQERFVQHFSQGSTVALLVDLLYLESCQWDAQKGVYCACHRAVHLYALESLTLLFKGAPKQCLKLAVEGGIPLVTSLMFCSTPEVQSAAAAVMNEMKQLPYTRKALYASFIGDGTLLPETESHGDLEERLFEAQLKFLVREVQRTFGEDVATQLQVTKSDMRRCLTPNRYATRKICNELDDEGKPVVHELQAMSEVLDAQAQAATNFRMGAVKDSEGARVLDDLGEPVVCLLQPEPCTTSKGMVLQARQAQEILRSAFVPTFKSTSKGQKILTSSFPWIDCMFDPGVMDIQELNAKVQFSHLKERGGFRRVCNAASIELHFGSCRRLVDAVKEVEKLFGSAKVRRVQNRHKTPTVLGASDICMLVEVDLRDRDGNTHICEVRLMHMEFVKARERGLSSLISLGTDLREVLSRRTCPVAAEEVNHMHAFILHGLLHEQMRTDFQTAVGLTEADPVPATMTKAVFWQTCYDWLGRIPCMQLLPNHILYRLAINCREEVMKPGGREEVLKPAMYVVTKGSVQVMDTKGHEYPRGKTHAAPCYFGQEQLCLGDAGLLKDDGMSAEFHKLFAAHKIPLSDCSKLRLHAGTEGCKLIYLTMDAFMKQLCGNGELHKLEQRKIDAGFTRQPIATKGKQEGQGETGVVQGDFKRQGISIEHRLRLFGEMVIREQHFHPDREASSMSRELKLPLSWLSHLCNLLSEASNFQMQANAVHALAMLCEEPRVAEQIANDPKIIPRLFELMNYATYKQEFDDGSATGTGAGFGSTTTGTAFGSTTMGTVGATGSSTDPNIKISAAYAAITCIRRLAEIKQGRINIRRGTKSRESNATKETLAGASDEQDMLAWAKEGGILELLWKRQWAPDVELHLVRTVWLLLKNDGHAFKDHGARDFLLSSNEFISAEFQRGQLEALVRMLEPNHTPSTRAMTAGVIFELCATYQRKGSNLSGGMGAEWERAVDEYTCDEVDETSSEQQVLLKFGADSVVHFSGTNVIELLATIVLEDVDKDELGLYELNTAPVRTLLRLLESPENKAYAWKQKDSCKAYANLNKKTRTRTEKRPKKKSPAMNSHEQSLWAVSSIEVGKLMTQVQLNFPDAYTKGVKTLVQSEVKKSCGVYGAVNHKQKEEGGSDLLMLTHRIEDMDPPAHTLQEYEVTDLEGGEETQNGDTIAPERLMLLLQPECCVTVEGLIEQAKKARVVIKSKLAPKFQEWCKADPEKRYVWESLGGIITDLSTQ
jgi:hypothetical protein